MENEIIIENLKTQIKNDEHNVKYLLDTLQVRLLLAQELYTSTHENDVMRVAYQDRVTSLERTISDILVIFGLY